MKASRLLAALAVASLVTSGGLPVQATTFDDPLHGVCTGCSDNGVITPITSGQLATGFGWSFSGTPGDNVGTLNIVLLAPVGDGFVGSSLTGTNLSMPTAFSFVGQWTGAQDLSVFVGLPQGSPANPIGGFEVGDDATATAFNVFKLTVPGILTIGPVASALTNVFQDNNGVLAGLELVAFLSGTPDGTVSTALSGDLQVAQLAATPIPPAVALFLGPLLGLWWWVRRRAQIA
jgi:hypothetical protein